MNYDFYHCKTCNHPNTRIVEWPVDELLYLFKCDNCGAEGRLNQDRTEIEWGESKREPKEKVVIINQNGNEFKVVEGDMEYLYFGGVKIV